jgi:hypothetical protein
MRPTGRELARWFVCITIAVGMIVLMIVLLVGTWGMK